MKVALSGASALALVTVPVSSETALSFVMVQRVADHDCIKTSVEPSFGDAKTYHVGVSSPAESHWTQSRDPEVEKVSIGLNFPRALGATSVLAFIASICAAGASLAFGQFAIARDASLLLMLLATVSGAFAAYGAQRNIG